MKSYESKIKDWMDNEVQVLAIDHCSTFLLAQVNTHKSHNHQYNNKGLTLIACMEKGCASSLSY